MVYYNINSTSKSNYIDKDIYFYYGLKRYCIIIKYINLKNKLELSSNSIISFSFVIII